MCVINCINSKDEYPTESQINDMSEANPHFCSIAYFDESKKVLVYKKGIEKKEIKKILKMCKFKNFNKIVCHYRIASSGSAKNKALNHPFEISNSHDLLQNDSCHNDLFFHNGTIDMEILNDIAIKIIIENPKVIYPKGEISDSKLLAFIIGHTNTSILRLFPKEKFTIFTKDGRIINYGGFEKVKNIHCSNSYFDEPKNITWFNNDYMQESEKNESLRLQKKYDVEGNNEVILKLMENENI